MLNQLHTMLNLQDKMNTRVHSDWRHQGYAWYRAVWTECAELMEHYGWKWWKKQTPDMPQVSMELIDIWHFGLSMLIQQNVSAEHIEQELSLAFSQPATSEFRELLEDFTANLLQTKQFDIQGFAHLMQAIDMDFESLFKSYLGKNVLNFFRQDNGYKEGSYIKQWHGQEDNEHLVEILENLDTNATNASEQVYSALQQRYPASKQS